MTGPQSAGAIHATLSEIELRLLDFERSWADRAGNREAAIRAEFGVSSARYYQMLYALIDSPLAVRDDPILVRRLQRLRDARRRARARSFASDSTARLNSQDDTD
jgi:IS4 transposase